MSSAQSICGMIVEKRGNQMPGPGRTPSKGQPIAREVAVFPLLAVNQVTSDEAGFITDLKGVQPLQSSQSAKDGTFCFSQLPVGRYSVLVHESKGWYANSFDTQNHLNPVTVTSSQTATMIIQITHRAAF